MCEKDIIKKYKQQNDAYNQNSKKKKIFFYVLKYTKHLYKFYFHEKPAKF